MTELKLKRGSLSRQISILVIGLFLSGVLCSIACSKDRTTTGYLLGVRDVINVMVLAGGQKEVEARLEILDQGTVNVPFMGNVKARGLTVRELEKNIYTLLERDFFVDPQVHITVEEYHSLNYFIAGAVKTPGMYELNFVPSLMDLIVKAGGVEEGRGNIAYVLRDAALASMSKQAIESEISKKEPIKIDLMKLLDQGDMSENIMLSSGDTVYVPLGKVLNQARSKIYVQGQVKMPGVFDSQPGMTALSACILAGGFSKYAAPGRTRIVRNGGQHPKTIKIDLDKVIDGQIPDIPLVPGDRINVPESWF